MHKDKKALKKAGINIVAISYDPPEVLKRFADRGEIDYPMLYDEGSKVIDAFGIRNVAMDGKKFGKNELTGIPYPGTYVVSDDGVILGKIFLERYQDRHSTQAIIDLVGEVAK